MLIKESNDPHHCPSCILWLILLKQLNRNELETRFIYWLISSPLGRNQSSYSKWAQQKEIVRISFISDIMIKDVENIVAVEKQISTEPWKQ